MQSPCNVSSIFDVLLKVRNIHKNFEKSDNEEKFEGSVLIAEDHPINQELLVALLKTKGNIKFSIANNGKEAISLFKDKRYDVIFMDINMPLVSGIAALKSIIEIEKQKNLSHTPIVALTANAIQSDREKFLSIGFDDYLSKPIEEEKLNQILKKYLPLQKTKKANLQLPKQIIDKLRDKFFNNLPSELKELQEAIAKKDMQKIFAISHKLKGVSANLGLDDITQITSTMEEKSRNNQDFDYNSLLEKIKQISKK